MAIRSTPCSLIPAGCVNICKDSKLKLTSFATRFISLTTIRGKSKKCTSDSCYFVRLYNERDEMVATNVWKFYEKQIRLFTALLCFGSSQNALASFIRSETSEKDRIDGKRVCVTFIHRYLKERKGDPASTTEPIECRLKLTAFTNLKKDSTAPTVAAWNIFHLNKEHETCFDFSEHVASQEFPISIETLKVLCMPLSRAPAYFYSLKNPTPNIQVKQHHSPSNETKKMNSPLLNLQRGSK